MCLIVKGQDSKMHAAWKQDLSEAVVLLQLPLISRLKPSLFATVTDFLYPLTLLLPNFRHLNGRKKGLCSEERNGYVGEPAIQKNNNQKAQR